MHVGKPIFFTICLPFLTIPSIDHFLLKSLLAFSKDPFSKSLLIRDEETIFFLTKRGFGLTTLKLYFAWFLINSLTSPSLLLPNLKLLLTNINQKLV